MTSLLEHRTQFPALANKLYFNYGGQGPLPQAALDAILAGYTQMQQDGPFTRKALDIVISQVDTTHQAIATELGVSAASITLTEAVSVGCNIVLWGLPWQPGDCILMSDCEHPGVIAAVQEICRRFGVALDLCPLLNTLNEGDPVAAIAERVRPQTRLVVISHILWNTGQVLPLAAIIAACRRQNPNVLLLIDAAQSVGVLPLNLSELDVDFYAFTGHKWCCGPDGVGGLYIRPALHELLQPTFIGWRGIRIDSVGQPVGWKPDGTKFEVATSAFPLYCGLSAAIAVHQRWGDAQARYDRICQLSQRLWSQLQELPGVTCLKNTPPEAGLVSFKIATGSHADWVKQIEAQGMMTRLIVAPNCLRACVHYLTLESEIEQFVTALSGLVRAG